MTNNKNEIIEHLPKSLQKFYSILEKSGIKKDNGEKKNLNEEE